MPTPLVTGFTSGIAVIIFSSQVKDFLGLQMGDVPANFLEKLAAYSRNLGSVNVESIGVATLAVLIIIVWPRVNRRIPGPFVALVVTTAIVSLAHLDVETVGSRRRAAGDDSGAGFPEPGDRGTHRARRARIQHRVAGRGGIASLGRCRRRNDRFPSSRNMELVAQGVANIASPLFGGIPATGAIARVRRPTSGTAAGPRYGIVHAYPAPDHPVLRQVGRP